MTAPTDITVTSFATYGQRLAYCMERANIKPSALARATGLTPAGITYLKGVEEAHSCGEGSIRIADYFKVSPKWLCLGEGEPPAELAAGPAKGSSTVKPAADLSLLQAAALQQLEKVMRAGTFSDDSALDLLNSLRAMHNE